MSVRVKKWGQAGMDSMWSAWAWYQETLVKQPVRTQMVTSGLLWSFGDMLAQAVTQDFHHLVVVERGRPPDAPPGVESFGGGVLIGVARLDWKRVGTAGLFGAAFVGPVGHFWYQFLEYVCTKRLAIEPNSTRFVATKLFADTFLFGPLHLLAFSFYIGFAAGKSFVQVRHDIQRDFMSTFMAEAVIWMCVQVANFRFVPVKHQLLFVNCFCVVDSAFLSWVKHSDHASWKHWQAATPQT